MVAINPLHSAPIDYYALWDAYAAGIQPVIRDGAENAGGNREPIHFPKGIGLVFQKDTFVNHSNAAMLEMISKYSPPSKRAAEVFADPVLQNFVNNRRIAAHLAPLSLYVY